MSRSERPRKPAGHRVTYRIDTHPDGAFRSMTAHCGCGWTYTNAVKTDVRQQAAWHRAHTRRQQ